MAIYRGAGGAGDATGDSASEALLVRELAAEVQLDANAAEAARAAAVVAQLAAETAETNAETAETNAETAETNAETAASSASSSASTATTQAGIATTQATNASNSATAAASSASSASTSATNAASSATSAASSATSATSSKNAAATSATNAASSATSAASSATSAAASFDSFDDRYLGTKTSAPSVDNDGNALLTGALYFNSVAGEMFVWNGSSWVTVANSTSATNAANSATAAATSATNAANSATAAATSATNAANSATSASTSASTASTAATTATTQATNAATSATSASTSATNAATSATNAASSATSASASAAAASAVALGNEPVRHSVRPSLLLDFANTKQLDPRITFTRASTGTYFDANGILQTAASGVARFEHNPVTGESLGLEIEEQRTNLFTYSEQFDNAIWAKGDVTLSVNSIISPDGVLSADKIIATSTNAAHTVGVAIPVTSGTSYTFTFYAKAGEFQFAGLLFGSAGFGTNTVDTFNLSTGIVGTNSSGTATMTSVGNGWYRCSTTRTASATTSSTFQMRVGNNSGSTGFAGDGFSGIYIWGAQLETGSFATSYIPTVASQVTRSADSASMTGTNFSSWYRADEGTVYTETITSASANYFGLFSLNDGTNNNRIQTSAYSGSIYPEAYLNGATQFYAGISGVVSGTAYKHSFAVKFNDAIASKDGTNSALDSAFQIPVPTQLIFGRINTNSFPLNGTIKKFAYYPKRLTNAELQGLTTN